MLIHPNDADNCKKSYLILKKNYKKGKKKGLRFTFNVPRRMLNALVI
jgi:hypothetical protein